MEKLEFTYHPAWTHPIMRGLFILSLIISPIALMTIVNSIHRYDSMPPFDFVVAAIMPIILLSFRCSAQIDYTGFSTITIRLFFLRLYQKKFEAFSYEIIKGKRPSIEFKNGKGKVAAVINCANENQLRNLMLSINPAELLKI